MVQYLLAVDEIIAAYAEVEVTTEVNWTDFIICLVNAPIFKLHNLIANAQPLTAEARSKIASPVLNILARHLDLNIKCLQKGLDF